MIIGYWVAFAGSVYFPAGQTDDIMRSNPDYALWHSGERPPFPTPGTGGASCHHGEGACVMMQPKQEEGRQRVASRKPWQHCQNPWVQPCSPWTCWSRELMHAFCLIQFQMAVSYFEAQRFWNYTKPIHLCSTFWFPKSFTCVFIIVWITWETQTLWDNLESAIMQF